MKTNGEGPSWDRVDALFGCALELDPEKRATFLDEICEGDAGLRRAVEELLAADTEAASSGFLDRPAVFFWRSLWEEAVRESFDQHSLSEPSSTC